MRRIIPSLALLVLVLGPFLYAGNASSGNGTTTQPTPTPGCTNDTWAATSTGNAPFARSEHTAVWTGSEMIVWGGGDNRGPTNTGGRYNPATDSWTPISAAALARDSHSAVWTGTGNEMIVWGGGTLGSHTNTGGRYNPDTDTWVPTSTTNAPSGDYFHTAVWTGSEMIIWGGLVNGSFSSPTNTGGRYNPLTDSWAPTSVTNPPSARWAHTAVWTGSEMIIWGGWDGSAANTGGRYNPATELWTPTSIANAPSGRYAHSAVWTGSEMIIWGGASDSTGGRYNPSTDTWTVTSIANAPSPRSTTAIWTGTEMIIWGDTSDSSGGRYNPVTDTWTPTRTPDHVPSPRSNHTAIWAGTEMIVWGGNDNSGGWVNIGDRYCAQPPVYISGGVPYCSNPSLDPVPGVALTVTGDETTSTMTDSSGAYILSLVSGGSYVVTPTKAALTPGSAGIDTIDVIATQRHFLGIAFLTGCRLTAADVNGDSAVDTVDVIAVQRFYLGLTSGIANVGKYQFTPANRSYSNVVSDQPGQNYDALVFGDVAAGFVEP